jgi:ribonuclease P protein component
MESHLYPKEERLLNRKDFVNLNRVEKRYLTGHFTVFFKENGLDVSRLGITVSKKIGKAVKRNRIKRLLREFFRLNKKIFPKGFDVVFVANKGAQSLIYWEIQEELSEIILDKKSCL